MSSSASCLSSLFSKIAVGPAFFGIEMFQFIFLFSSSRFRFSSWSFPRMILALLVLDRKCLPMFRVMTSWGVISIIGLWLKRSWSLSE